MSAYNRPLSSNPYNSPAGGYAGGMGGADSGKGMSGGPIEELRQTRPWVIFFSVLFFIGSAFSILGGACVGIGSLGFMGMAGSAGAGAAGAGVGAMMLGLALLYVIIGFLYIMPGIFLWQYGSRIGDLMSSRSERHLQSALQAQKSFWRFVGIVTAIMLVLYVLMIVAMMAMGPAMQSLNPSRF